MVKSKLTLFKLLLISQTLGILIYTFCVAKDHGWGLIQIFIDNVSALTWNGQFNLDFSCYLLLSGFWIMWRDKFSISSILIGLIASVAGIIFFAPYLLYLLIIEKYDLEKVFLGKQKK